MKEIDVFNRTRTFLHVGEFFVVQLVPPGGQAPLSVSFTLEGARKTVFPDLLAIKDDLLWIGELKPAYDADDHNKLKALRAYGESELLDLCERVTKGQHKITSVNYVLCHAEQSSNRCHSVYQWIFNSQEVLPEVVRPSE